MLGLYWTVWDRFIQVLYLGRAPRTKETLPDFLKWRWVTRHPLVFRGLTGSQRTPGVWGVTLESQRSRCIDERRGVFKQNISDLSFSFFCFFLFFFLFCFCFLQSVWYGCLDVFVMGLSGLLGRICFCFV